MKKRILLCFLFFVLLCGCAKKTEAPEVRVIVEDGAHYTLEVNAVTVEVGGSAAFYIDTEQGYKVTGVEYDGPYQLLETRGLTKLVVEEVRYPTRLRLTLSFCTRTIEYQANGGKSLTGEGTVITRSYDVTEHIRPNVSIGTDLFSRDGYTMTGWNTKPDGSGQRVGLGSRMTVDSTVVLYAQWAKWTDSDTFLYEITDGSAVITGCTAAGDTLVIPETLGGCTVERIAAHALENSEYRIVILPKTIKQIEDLAFSGAALEELHFFDNIEYIADACFSGCSDLSTLCISAIEDPYGYSARRESVWVDKLDVLMTTMGQKRVIFYGGCSMWYNLNGTLAAEKLGSSVTVLNMGLNGVVSSLLQMELLKHFVTENDVLFHTPEIASRQQLIQTTKLTDNDAKLWCALEYNYDLVQLLDIRVFESGVFDSLNYYLDKKDTGGSYTDSYTDSKGRIYLDETLSIPYLRTEQDETVTDEVELMPELLQDLSRLEQEYRYFTEKGVTVYVSYACIDVDRLPEGQALQIAEMGQLFADRFSAMEGVTLVGRIEDFCYPHADFFDTVYHLLTEPANRCTEAWLELLIPELEKNGFLAA